MKTKIRSILLLLTSALFIPLAVPNEFYKYGQALVAFFCLVPLYILFTRLRSFRRAALYGIIFAVITTLTTYYWLVYFGSYSVWTIGGVTLAYILFFSIFFPILFGLFRIFPNYRPLVFGAVWAVWEYLKSTGFLGFPWGLLPHPVHQLSALIQIADITGIWGISFLLAFFNGIVGEGFLQYNRFFLWIKDKSLRTWSYLKPLPVYLSQAMVLIVLLLLTLSYGFYRLFGEIPFEKEVSVLLVQQNKNSWEDNNEVISLLEAQKLTFQGMADAPEKPDLVAWSETSLRWPIIGNEKQFELFPPQGPLLPFVRKLNTYFLVGAPTITDWDTYDAVNSTVLLSKEGEVLGYYGKQHPVPITEYNPLWDFEVVRKFIQQVIGLQSVWVIGKEAKVFETRLKSGKTLKFSTPICFEDSFPDVCRDFILKGADLWINLTNVSWSQTDSAELQMFIASKFRCIENRRVLIRSTNAGVTSVVGPYGNTLKSLPLFKPAFLFMKVPVYKENLPTVYTLLGDYVPALIFIVLIFLLVCKRLFLIKALGKFLDKSFFSRWI
ncbi:MAG: apolipoprotein N-acyltransferase [Spirochaetales bacterium]|nr:apolipoprotein N-acyltransferase [Spirochaetales bacterium]